MKMNGSITAYRNWAPDGVLWTEWVKPVLFTNIPSVGRINVNAAEINWIGSVVANTAIIVDLPGVESVVEAMALARMGYRPIPLYNGVNGADGDLAGLMFGTVSMPVSSKTMLVDSQTIAAALYSCAGELSALNIEDDAPPVFMLDSNRMEGTDIPQPGMFDNRWRVFPQDMPSAEFLKKQGIKKVLVRTTRNLVENDLEHILLRYRKHGIRIATHDGEGDEKRWNAFEHLRLFKSLFYRLSVTVGLRRNAAGGFGGIIPEPSSGSGMG